MSTLLLCDNFTTEIAGAICYHRVDHQVAAAYDLSTWKEGRYFAGPNIA